VNCSKRVIGIIETLIDQSEYVAVAEIGDKLGISKRTVFREMDEVERVAHSLGMEVVKKTRLGIKINATEEQIIDFRKISEACDDPGYDQESRQNQMIGELLKTREPRKFYHFSKMLDVSEATISYDMDKIEPWFASKGIKLIRKPGYGVYLEGTEKQFRKAIVDFLYQNYEHEDLLTLFSSGLQSGAVMDTVLDKDILIKVNGILSTYKSDLSQKLTENAYMGLTIHLAIAVQRILRGEEIHMNQEILLNLSKDMYFEIAREIGAAIETVFEIQFPQDELGYITMHLKGSKLKTGSIVNQDELILTNFEVTRVASSMIHKFKELSGYNLQEDDQLLIGLVTHLRPAITRLKLNLEIRNPLLDKIMEMYPEIFNMSQKVSKVLEDSYEIELPLGEIGYIAMHFGASIERIRKQISQMRSIRVGVVCASGVGTSSLLYSRLSKIFPQIDLVKQLSKEDVESGKHKAFGIELLVSTIHLDQKDIPTVHVNPLLLEEDVTQLKQIIPLVKVTNSMPNENRSSLLKDDSEDIRKLHETTEAILEIEKNLRIHEFQSPKSIKELIGKIAETSVDTSRQKKTLQKELLERERLGSTLLHGENAMLIHTKTNTVSGPIFALWRLSPAMKHPSGEAIELAIVMLLKSDAKSVYLELFSRISKALIEHPDFLKILKNDPVKNAENEIKKILHSYLKQYLNRGGRYE
jgi:mannitol operon transcriptional antiterminator